MWGISADQRAWVWMPRAPQTQADNADELWVISLASCSSEGGEATLNSTQLLESCGGGVVGREGDSHNPNNTLWNSALVRLTGFAGEQSFHTHRFCNCRGKPWYKLQKVKRQESLFLDPFWSGADPRAWITEPAEHRMLQGRSRLWLCTALDVRAATKRGRRWWSLAWEHSLHDSFPKKHLKVSQLRSSQPRDFLLFRNLVYKE